MQVSLDTDYMYVCILLIKKINVQINAATD